MDTANDMAPSSSEGVGLSVTTSTPLIGAEIAGVDLRNPLTPTMRDAIQRLLVRHQVLFWREQDITTEQQIAFAESFGPRLSFASVVDAAAGRAGSHDVHGSTVGWHIDASSMLEPPVATVLRAVDVPAEGGDTIWASGVAAFNALPDTLKTELEGLYVTHGGAPRQPGSVRPLVAHPLVQVHPDTGHRYLYINFAPWADALILGLSNTDSASLVTRLRDLYLRPEHQVRFRWNRGAVAMWDNRAVQHTGTHDYGTHPRHMTRTCIARFENPAPTSA